MTSPEEVLSQTDPGDDMQRRVRYQAAYGALLCMDLLLEDQMVAVFCEHHEDFLVKRACGTYIGVQVKTQLPGLGPFKTNDEAVFNAFKRFVELDKDFSGQFDSFTLVANCDFYTASNDETNLRVVLDKLKKNSRASFKGTMKNLIEKLSESTGRSKKAVCAVLAKVNLEGDAPKFQDILAAVAAKIGRNRPEIDHYQRVLSCAEALVERVQKASALPCDQPVRSNFVLSSSPVEAAIQQTIDHKRITREIVLETLESSAQCLLTQQSVGNMLPLEFPVGHHILEQKMATGDISTSSITTAKDLQTSAEYILQQWIFRYGSDVAAKRFAHIDLIVRNQCDEAFDSSYSGSYPFGKKMLAEVREKLKGVATDKEHVFGLKYEQLLGFVSLATQKCRVWWSDKFEIGDDSNVSL